MWSSQPPGETTIASFYTVEDGWIMENQLYLGDLEYDNNHSNHTTLTASCTWDATIKIRKVTYNCKANFYKRFLAANPDVVFLKETVDALQGSVKFRDPNITETTKVAPREVPAGTGNTAQGISDKDFDDYISVISGTSSSVWEKSIDDLNTRVTQTQQALIDQNRTGDNNNNTGKGSQINPNAPDIDAAWGHFTANTDTLKTNCDKRIAEVDARIGIPKYVGSAAAKGSPPAIHVEKIPSSNTTSGLLPYGRSIYNNVNYLLGQDVELLGKITKDIEALDDLIDLVKSDRNKYEIFSGRDKVY